MNNQSENVFNLKKSENNIEMGNLNSTEENYRKSEIKNSFLNNGQKQEDNNFFNDIFNKWKKLIWDPLDSANKVLCACSSLCLIFIFITLFYAFLIKG